MEFLNTIRSRLADSMQTRFPEFYEKLPAIAQLTRINRPIGILLLLWPTLIALWIASSGVPSLGLLLIFTIGTAVMRSAGCCINDYADRNIDAQVDRTQQRPLAVGTLSRRDAMICFLALSLFGLLLVLMTNRETILLSFGAIALVAIYPFMKRITNLPQVVLGVAFSWGILMAFTATGSSIPQAAYLLFIANAIWTVAYDTQYAMADREFDIQIGVKSTAILFGDADKLIIACLQLMFIISMYLAGKQFELGLPFNLSLLAASALLSYQQILIRDRLPGLCFKAFLNNNWVGAIVFLGVFLHYL